VFLHWGEGVFCVTGVDFSDSGVSTKSTTEKFEGLIERGGIDPGHVRRALQMGAYF